MRLFQTDGFSAYKAYTRDRWVIAGKEEVDWVLHHVQGMVL